MNKLLFKIFGILLLLLLSGCSSSTTSGVETLVGFNATKKAIIPVPFEGSIAENSLPAVIIGKVSVGGTPASQILTMKLSGTGSENFSISKDGVISVSNIGNLDYESVKIYNLIAEAIDGTGATLIAINVTINITDVAEVTPQILPFTGSVAENSSAGTLVGKLEMLGLNVNNLSAITLTGSGNTNFVVSVTGSITVGQGSDLNFEAVSSYTLNVSAIDKKGQSLAVSSVTISIIDVLEVAPSITPFKGTVEENSLATTVIGKLEIIGINAKDISSITLAGTGSSNFVVSNDGTISVASGAVLNYEAVNSYKLSVSITNSVGQVVTVSTVEINLINVLEVTPLIAPFTGTVPENSLAGTAVGTLTTAGITTTILSTYELVGTGKENFTISNTGDITVSTGAILNYENIPSYSLSVKALDKLGNTLALSTVDISLVNLVEVLPSITPFNGTVPENSVVDTVVGNLILTAMPSNFLTIRLTGSGSENFKVSSSGVISVNAGAILNYEGVNSYSFVVEAIDDLGKTITASTSIINLTNVVEVLPSINSFNGSVPENSLAGVIIGTLTTSGITSTVLSSFELVGTGKENFSISNIGVITVASGAILNYENVPSYSLTVKALDKLGNTLALSTVDISLVNLVEVLPSITPFNGTLPENSVVDIPVGQLVLIAMPSNLLSIRLTGSGSENFKVSTSGVISVNAGAVLNYEGVNSYSFVVEAVDSLGKVVTASTAIINLTNVVEIAPGINPLIALVPENSVAGTLVGTLTTVGISSTDLSTFELLGTGKENFTISNSGVISVASGAILNYENIPSYSLSVKALDKLGNTLAFNTVSITLVNLSEVLPSITSFNGTVPENSLVDTVVGNIILTAMPSNLLSIRLTGSGSENFKVSSSGVISVNAGAILNYEGVNSYSFVVEAIDNLGKTITASTAIINLTNVVEIAPSITAFIATVPENSPATTVVGTLSTAGIVSTSLAVYTFTGVGKENFVIDNTGKISVAQGAVLNYEGLNIFSLLVNAISTTGSILASNKVTINLSNVVEPIAGITAFTGSVAENSPVTTSVGTVVLTNMPTTLLSLRLTGTGSEKFTIDVVGNIKVGANANLNYEGVNKYSLIVEAIDNTGASITANTVVILLTNVVEPVPSISPFTASIAENTAVGTVVGTISMTDINTSALLSITLTGSGSEKFDINNTGGIKVATGATFSYTTQPNYNFIVQALDKNGISIAASTVKISLISGGFVSTVVPVISPFTANLNEYTASGTNVGNIIIVSQGDSNITSMRLLGTGIENFSISKDGNITVSTSANLVYATNSIYSLVAIATNTAGDSLSVTVTINIINITKTVPILKEFIGSVNENISIGTKIGTIDINTTGGVPILSMQLSGTGSSNFVVSSSGDLLLATAINLDSIAVPRYNLLVTATNSEGTSYAVPVTITVNNMAISKPIIDNVTITVSQTKAINSIIGSVPILTDGGGTIFKSFDLNITSTDFNISNSGLISLLPTKALNSTTKSRYDFNITATNNDNLTSDPKLLIINVTP